MLGTNKTQQNHFDDVIKKLIKVLVNCKVHLSETYPKCLASSRQTKQMIKHNMKLIILFFFYFMYISYYKWQKK